MHKPKQDGNNNPGIAIDFFCGSGGFATEVYISSFVVWLILLLGVYHARHFIEGLLRCYLHNSLLLSFIVRQ